MERRGHAGKEKIHGKKTSYSVIKDLETTDKYIKDTEKNTGQKYSPESLKSARAKVNRFFNRAGNALSRPAYFRPDDPKNNKEDQRAKEQQEAKEAREKIEEKKRKNKNKSRLNEKKRNEKKIKTDAHKRTQKQKNEETNTRQQQSGRNNKRRRYEL